MRRSSPRESVRVDSSYLNTSKMRVLKARPTAIVLDLEPFETLVFR
jgi:hypothetical protein